jgi:lysozyme
VRFEGLDVSSVQGVIDWKRVASLGRFRFAYCKATEGNAIRDPAFQRNAEGSRAELGRAGAYMFLGPKSPVEEQVRLFLDAIKPFDLRMPHAVDFEYPPPFSAEWNTLAPVLAGRCLEACQRIEQATGPTPIVYTYPFFGRTLPHTPELLTLASNYPLWIASYPGSKEPPLAETRRPAIPSPWRDFRCWQWVGNASPPVPGVAGPVDHNVWDGPLPGDEGAGGGVGAAGLVVATLALASVAYLAARGGV